MPYKEGQPSLMGFLGYVPVSNVAKKRLLGGSYIPFSNLCTVLCFMYESGAILGRARRDKLSILVKMLETPPTNHALLIKTLLMSQGGTIEIMRNEAKKRLDTFRSEVGKEPDTFFEFIQLRELERTIGLSLNDALKAYSEGDKRIMKALDEKVPLKEVEPYIKSLGLEGIGFGNSFPQLTERMYRKAHESIDMDVWSKWRAHGLAIPEKPTQMTLEEQEALILQMVAAYTSDYYPELLDPLDLRGYLDAM